MASKCRAGDPTSCRVHGANGMYEHLRQVSNDAINKRDFDTYHEARAKMEELTDDSKAALRFYARGGVPTLAERVGNKMNAFADRIIEARDNLNESITEGLDGNPDKPTIGGKIGHFADRVSQTRDNINAKVVEILEEPAEKDSFNGKVQGIFEHVESGRDKLKDAASEGVNIVSDRQKDEIPEDIGGSTVAWSDLNPFKSPFKNGKLR